MHGDQRLSAFVFVGYDIVEPGCRPAPANSWCAAPAWIVSVDRSRRGPRPGRLERRGARRPRSGPAVAEDLQPHSPDPSLMDRIEGAGEGLLEAFGLG